MAPKTAMETLEKPLAVVGKWISLLLSATFVVWLVYEVGRLSYQIEHGPQGAWANRFFHQRSGQLDRPAIADF